MGGGTKVYPVGSVEIIKVSSGNSSVSLQWSDPQDTTLEAITFAQWAGTIVVRKENEAPKSEKDGVMVLDNKVRDAYKDTPFTDEGVESGKTYYYGLFPYTVEGIFNYSADNLAKVYVTLIPPVFSDASWEMIAYACQNNCVPDTWEVGDEKDLVLTGGYGQTVTMQIWGKGLDTYTDGGTAPLTFGMKNLLDRQFKMHNAYGSTAGWIANSLRTSVMPAILECFPDSIKDAVREVNIWWSLNGGRNSSNDKLWIPSMDNVGFRANSGSVSVDHQYPVFTDDLSRIKKMSNGNGGNSYWWLRNALPSDASKHYITSLSGSISTASAYLSNNVGVCFCFCL